MIIKYIILGILSSITEILSISKLGHFNLYNNLFNTNMFNDITFIRLSNLSLIISIIIIYYKDFKKILKKDNIKYFKYYIILLFPLIIYFIFRNIKYNLFFTGIFFLIMSLLLFLVRKKENNKTIKDLTFKDFLLLSLFSSIFIFPGISKLGLFIVFLKFKGIKKEKLLKYSLFLSFPLDTGLFLSSFLNLNKITINFPYYIIGLIVCLIFDIYLIKNYKKNNLKKVIIYLLIIGLISIIVN